MAEYQLPFTGAQVEALLNIANALADWAKASEKPTYTAEEVGARPSTWMPTASDVGARPSTWTPSASDVGADPSGTAAGAVSSHNTAEDAHNDIRLLVEGLATRLNTLADSDDETLDQVSELVAYIKANRSLIEQITTGKVSVSDIIDNLTTNVANKPLSAAQGVKLKALIDAITVPTKVSQLENDSKFLTQHQDISGKANVSDMTAHTGNSTVHITAAERILWNSKVDSVPDYVVAEAERVTGNVQSCRTANSLVVVMASDFHNYEGNTASTHPNTRESIECLGMGIRELNKRMQIDAFVSLGDYSWMDGSGYTEQQVKSDIIGVLKRISEHANVKNNIFCIGNHDLNYGSGRDRMLTYDELYAYIGAKSNGEKPYSDKERCYGYTDFCNQKIRLIYLNTCDTSEWPVTSGKAAKSEWMSANQINWLANTALNFTEKSDPSEWGIVICSHHPLQNGYPVLKFVLQMLEGYKNGTSGSYTYKIGETNYTISYDFTSLTDRAEIICNLHGHYHNFNSGLLSSDPSAITPWLRRICIPNISASRYNEVAASSDETAKNTYGEFDSSGNPVYWTKASGTAKATSFCIVNIERKNKMIYVSAFGAGKDRIFSYAPLVYAVTTSLENCTGASSNPPTITDGESITLTFTASSGYTLPPTITVIGAAYTWDNSTGTLVLSNPTGDVTISIRAETITPSYTNQIPISTDANGNIYNGVGYKENTYLSSGNEGSRNGVNLTGFIPIGTGSSDTATDEQVIYLQGIKSLPTNGNVRISFYDADKTTLGTRSATQFNTAPTIGYETDANGYIDKLDVSSVTYYYLTNNKKSTAFFRICAPEIGASSVITVNEPIE